MVGSNTDQSSTLELTVADQNDPEIPAAPQVPPVPPVESAPAAPAAQPAAEQPNPYAQQPVARAAPVADPYAAQQPYQAAPAYGYQPQPPKGLSITSMILGIAGLVIALCYGSGLLIALAGAITGHMAAKRQPHAKGFWLTGIITGWVGVGVALLWIVGLIIFFVALGGAGWSSYNDYY